jgi:hypothetical protein
MYAVGLELLWCISVGPEIKTNAPLWWGVVGRRGAVHLGRQEIPVKPLYLQFTIAVNLKLPLKSEFKHIHTPCHRTLHVY